MRWKHLSLLVLIAAALCMLAGVYYQWDLLVAPDVVIEPEITQADVLRYWNGLSDRLPQISDAAGEFAFAADRNDDGAIDAADRAASHPEWMRINDLVCNGRSSLHDRTPWLDDDLQLLQIVLPADVSTAAVLEPASDDAHYFEALRSDLISDGAAIQWPWRPLESFATAVAPRIVPLWLRAPVGTPTDRPLNFALRLRDGDGPAREANLPIQVVQCLGDPHYFAGVRDYLMERERDDTPGPKVFLDSVECASSENPSQFEMMRLVAMRHEVTKFEVLETYYDTSPLQPRIKNIFAAAARHPEQQVIVNGNYFHVDTGAIVPHGSACLGAVVHDYQVSPATGRHWWFTYPNDGRPRDADWYYQSYCLVQEENRPGTLELREEPREPNPYIPTISRDGVDTPAYMALGGINTIHNFVHSVCGRKSHVWLARVPDSDRTLVCLAMSDTFQSTSYCGGPAFRDKLRNSGVTIEEGNVSDGVPPGKSELAYFDGGASIAMAVNLDGEFEFPTYTARHEPRNRHVHVNNYAMFSVVDDEDVPPRD